MSSALTQNHQEYIQTKVNPTLEALVTQVLMERPENPVPFMIRWLAQQTQAPSSVLDAGEAEKLRAEIVALQAEVKELESSLLAAGGAVGAAAGAAAGIGDEEEEEEEDDDEGEDLPPPPANYLSGKPRASVSAEAYGDWNKTKHFTPPFHQKDEAQRQRLHLVLEQSFMFRGLEEENIQIIIGAMVESQVAAGTQILTEGEDGEVMFVIEQGSFECLKNINGQQKVVKQCGPGDFFGELALLYNVPRAASVRAREPSLVWQLGRETFNHIVRDASMKRRAKYESFLKSVPILAKLGDYERTRLADALSTDVVAAGSTVVTQGEQGSRMYIVESGELKATKKGTDGSEQFMEYKAGDYFGELALMGNQEPRAASVAATTEARLLWIDRKIFQSFLGSLEEILEKNKARYA